MDEGVQRHGRDETAAVEALGQRDLAEQRSLAERADGSAGRIGRRPLGGPRTQARIRQRARDPDGSGDRDGDGPPSRSATTPPANAASAPAAARPIPMNPTTRPTSRAGYMAPHRRRWNGPPNERLIQKTNATAIITGATGTTNTSRSEAAPMPRISASCAEERGPNRPAKALRRLATNGAAASADRPRGSRPPRRAIVGRRAVIERHRDADADRRDEVEREIAPERAPAR